MIKVLNFFVAAICLLFGLPLMDAQQVPLCLCRDSQPQFNAIWGPWSPTPDCQGGCNNGTRIRTRFCDVFYLNNTMFGRTECAFDEVCDSCAGLWGNWGSIGACSNGCGRGVQVEERSCYQRNTLGNIRISECFGQVNASVQVRNVSCTRMNNCSNPDTNPRGSTTTQSGASTTTSPSSMPLSTFRSRTELTTTSTAMRSLSSTTPRTRSPGGKSSIKAPTRPATSSGGVNTVALAAVLGAAAILSVTVVSVAAAVIFLKKKEKTSLIVTYSSSNGGNTVAAVTLRRSNEKSEDSHILPHALYEFESIDGETVLNNGTEVHRESTPSRTPNTEAVYFTVDDRHRSL